MVGSPVRDVGWTTPFQISRWDEHGKANIGPFIQLLDQVYDMHRNDSVS